MEGVSSAAIEVLVQSLINGVKEEYSLIRGLDKEAQQLQKTLGMIQSYLNGAKNNSITHDAVKDWLRDLEASAFDADNILDEISYHLLRKKVKKETMEPKNKVLSCFSSFSHIARKRNMALKIKQVNADFQSKNKTATELGLQSIVMNAAPTYALNASIETSSVTVDPIFIGRDAEVSEIVDELSQISREEKISILAIVGMGGMGKTTLTRKVFNHENIKARFGSLLWVHVSQIFDPIDLFKKILSTLTSQTSDGAETKEVLLKKLQEALKGKSYLLVLDDIWNEDHSKWEDFINSILGATSTMGNGILMSTRNENVASLVRPLYIHPLKVLSDEECWSIIKEKAFENGQVPSSGFEAIGRKIAERCGGLPLAANVVGAPLRCKPEQEWRVISEKWLSDEEGGDAISKILKLSFDYLPSPSLKKCFAYCSVFPKGRNIIKQELIEQWMAEGFLLQAYENIEEMESVGEKFINILLRNSLLQVSYKDEYGNVGTYCVMHDLVHDFAGSCFNQDRYKYMIFGTDQNIAKESAKCVRTLLLTSDDEISDTMFSDFESLRVLVLKNYRDQKLPNSSIRKLIHLRLLDISETRIRELPEWIGELHHLQTLRADAGYLRKLPDTLFKYLINLRHLYISLGVELPANIGRLTCLQTLTHFNVGDNKGGYGIEQLGMLKNLKGNLYICNLERVRDKEEALKANISHKPNLLELVFKWDLHRVAGETNDEESVLEGLQPHPNLKKLRIDGYKGRRFPSWTQKMEVRDQGDWVPLNNLVEITLKDCWECEEIPMLGHLPNLESLDLRGLKKVRFINSSFNKLTRLSLSRLEGLECLPDWLFYNDPNLTYLNIEECPKLRGLKNVKIMNSSFNKLTRLSLSRLEGLECLPDWLFYNNPNLEDLRIDECPKLRELPDGLHTLTSLERLTIRDCPNLKSIIGNNNNIPGGGSERGGGVLRRLSIERCGELVELPRQMVEYWAPSLVDLWLKELRSLQNLPMLIDCLAKSAARLETLTIEGVPKFMASSNSSSVESWPCGSLWNIEIDVSVEWSRESSGSIKETVEAMLKGCRNSLTDLDIKGRIDWDWLPASIQYLVSLEELWLESLGIQELPQWLGNLSSLGSLYLHSCNKLRRLPPGDAYKALTELYIIDCPELEVDSEWRNIPRLNIYVDDHRIKSAGSESEDDVI